MTVRALSSDEVDVYRSIRLEALQTDPGAFRSTFEHEMTYDDSTWLERLSAFGGNPGQVFVAEDGDTVPIGLVGIATRDGSAILWGMWVRASARGSGVGRALVDAAVSWARAADASNVTLEVANENGAARRLYERCGFEAIGQVPMDPDNPCSLATIMQLRL